MFGFDTVMLILGVASMIYSGVTYSQNASRAREAKKQAIQDYYHALQKGQTQSRVFKASQASAKTAKENSQKYTIASEQLQEEATAREKQTRPDAYTGHRPRTTQQRQKDFGNKYAAREKDLGDSEQVGLHIEVPLLSRNDYADRNFLKMNFNIFQCKMVGKLINHVNTCYKRRGGEVRIIHTLLY